MGKEKYRTFWLVDGEKITDYQTLKRLVNSGKTGIEVSATRQEISAQNQELQLTANARRAEEYRKVAAEQDHRNSPEGQRQAAVRFAAQNPGGHVSGGMDRLAELDAYSPASTNLLR